ncbi:MAG: hypothetical protein GY706_15860, partial [Bacteroides sp.]|nr:hypothetical protein [Bacteroides sp.]
FEDVMNIIDTEKPDGIIVQFGGQTPLNLARFLEAAGAPIIGTTVESIDLAENRDKFSEILRSINIMQTENASVYTKEDAFIQAERIGYPVVVRPSYVLGGRAMRIVYTDDQLKDFIQEAVSGIVSGPVRQTDCGYEQGTGNLVTKTFWNDDGPDPVVSMTYDDYGNIQTETDALGNTTTTEYDSLK